jgi:hypothetical protein
VVLVLQLVLLGTVEGVAPEDLLLDVDFGLLVMFVCKLLWWVGCLMLDFLLTVEDQSESGRRIFLDNHHQLVSCPTLRTKQKKKKQSSIWTYLFKLGSA